MSNFLREFEVATERTCSAPWSGVQGGVLFYCAFCGYKFNVGDEYRAIYTNDLPNAGGNPLTCRSCFTASGGEAGLRSEWSALCNEFDTRFKWFKDRFIAYADV